MTHFAIFITATVLLLAAAGIISWDLAPLLLAPRDPERGSLAARIRAHLASVHADAMAAVRDRKLRAEPPLRPDHARLLQGEAEGPAEFPHAGPGTGPGDPVPGPVPLTPRGRHHHGQPRQPWLTAPMAAVPACETEPLPVPEEYICEPWEAVPGFYRHHLWQQYRRLS